MHQITGHIGDEIIYRASLAPEDYDRVLAAVGLATVEFAIADKDCGGATVLLAQKQGA